MRSLRKKSDLRPYQIWMAKKIKGRKNVLLAVDMGLGKTASALTAARRLLDEFVIRKVLIIAPLFVAENTWPEEIAAWEHLAPLKYSVLTGDPKQRLRALEEKTEINIINRENVPWLWRTLGRKNWRYDMIIYDESSRLKSGKKRTKGGKNTGKRLSEFGALAKARHLAKYVVELTGTPSPNGLIDLWGQAYILDLGERLGGTRTAFLRRWFDSDYMGWTYEPKHYAQKQIMARLSDVMFGLRAEDHIDLPPVQPNVIKVNLPKKVMKEYRSFEESMVSEVYDVEAVSSGVLTNKLLQFANGSLYRDIEDSYPRKREVIEVHDAKLAGLESVVAEAAGAPILCAYSFKFDLKRILKKYPKAHVLGQDKEWKKKWDQGKIELLLAHPASMGHGLNLQFGGHIACWYGLTWSLELYEQFNARLPRPGQTHPFVQIHHIIAAGTADEDVLEAMRTKGATQKSITNAVRRRILAYE